MSATPRIGPPRAGTVVTGDADACIAAYRWLHPDQGIPLALSVSGLSRNSREDRPPETDRLWREIAEPRFREGFDGVLIGHFHQALDRREDGKQFIVLGDWIEHFTYAELEDGQLALKTWPEAK